MISTMPDLKMTVFQEPEPWQPTQEGVEAWVKDQGWPVFSDIRYDHLDQSGVEQLETAVQAVKGFVESLKDKPGQALLMIASEVAGDSGCTGFGCGKTTLAKIAHYANAGTYWVPDEPGTFWVRPYGTMYEAREVMALFDRDNFDLKRTFADFGNLVVIDDVGREGSLRWERRDPELQAQEKRDRYYNIIDYCYENKVSLILTSNMTSRELAEFLGGASWSRLLQMAPKSNRLNLTGLPDMRPLLAESGWF